MSYESYAYIQRSLLTKDAISLNFRASCHSKDKILKIVRRGSHFIIKSDLQNFKYKFLNINNGEIKNKQIVGTK